MSTPATTDPPEPDVIRAEDWFNIPEKRTVTREEYNKILNAVRHIYNIRNAVPNAQTHTYICKQKKHKQSSGPKPQIPGEREIVRRLGYDKQDPDKCQGQMKAWFIPGTNNVQIWTKPNHSHTIDVSHAYRRSNAVKDLIDADAGKGYALAAILLDMEKSSSSILSNISRRNASNFTSF
jgi:hypothetical protein